MKEKYVLLNNLGRKQGLVITYGQILSYYKRRVFVKNYTKKCVLDTSHKPFCIHSINDIQSQPPRGVLNKSSSENMQQIYRRTPMPKCEFNKITKQLY